MGWCSSVGCEEIKDFLNSVLVVVLGLAFCMVVVYD